LFHQFAKYMDANLVLPKVEEIVIPVTKDEWHNQLIDKSVIPCTQVGLALAGEFLKYLHISRLALEKYANEVKIVRAENKKLREGIIYQESLQALSGDLLDISKAYMQNGQGLIVPMITEDPEDSKKQLNEVEEILQSAVYGEEKKEDPNFSVLTFSELEKPNSSYFPNGSLSFTNTERQFYSYLPARYHSDAGVFVTASTSKLDDALKILVKQVQLAVNEYSEVTTNNFYDASEKDKLGQAGESGGWEKRTLNVVIKGLEQERKQTERQHTDKQLIFLLDNDKVEEEFKILYRTAMQERKPAVLKL